MTANKLQAAAQSAFASGSITRQQHDELVQFSSIDWELIFNAVSANSDAPLSHKEQSEYDKLSSLDWATFFQALPLILRISPRLAQLAPLISKIIEFFSSRIPSPTPTPDDSFTPVPHR